jgi:hypothetical protein
MNLKQQIEYYEGLVGPCERPEYSNDQQYLDFLKDIHAAGASSPKAESVPVVKKTS